MMQLQKISGLQGKASKEKEEDFSAVKVKQKVDVAYTTNREEVDSFSEVPEDVYYNSNSSDWQSRYNDSRRGARQNFRPGGNGKMIGRGGFKKFNPTGTDRKPSTCAICGLVLHRARECPHNDERSEKGSTHEEHIVLMNIEDKNSDGLSLLGYTVCSIILDSGCPTPSQ